MSLEDEHVQACLNIARLTTATIERVFIVSSRRTSLSDEMFEYLLFNHLNGDLRPFSGGVDEMFNGRKRKFINCEQQRQRWT